MSFFLQLDLESLVWSRWAQRENAKCILLESEEEISKEALMWKMYVGSFLRMGEVSDVGEQCCDVMDGVEKIELFPESFEHEGLDMD